MEGHAGIVAPVRLTSVTLLVRKTVMYDTTPLSGSVHEMSPDAEIQYIV